MRFGPRGRAAVEINLTPLIDILFIVLLFLVMTATFARRTFIQLELPQSTTARPEGTDPNVVRVDIQADGGLYLAGQAVDPESVRQYLLARPDRTAMTVVIAADERTPHGQVVRIIDLVRESAVRRLHLETVPARAP